MKFLYQVTAAPRTPDYGDNAPNYTFSLLCPKLNF